MPSVVFTRDGLLDSSINTCTADPATDLITVASVHGLSAGDQVRFTTTNTLPAPLDGNTRYYVLSTGLTTTALKIALTAGGAVIDITSAGTGTHTIWNNSKWDVLQTGFGYRGTYAAIDDVPIGQWAGGDLTMPAAYLGHTYNVTWIFATAVTLAVQSGSLPPGLVFNEVDDFTKTITGTPTTLGTYTFVLRASRGGGFGDATFHITVNADPDEGVGGVGGG